MAKRINRVIELIESKEPVYYTSAGDLTYENGLKQASTWADFLIPEFEHGAFNVAGLISFMKGLVDSGPTKAGHRTPAIIATLPASGRTASEMRANAWQIRQLLSTGVHGILLTHARQADAVRAFVEECRYPFHKSGRQGLGEGQRGAGGQVKPAEIWGIDAQEYVNIADPWPLNPEGELFLGVKLENQESAANAEAICSVPGLAFAEWGPSDMGMSFGFTNANGSPYIEEMNLVRERIKAACDDNNLNFLCSWNDPGMTEEQKVRKLMDLGTHIFAGGEEMANIERKITQRKMPVG